VADRLGLDEALLVLTLRMDWRRHYGNWLRSTRARAVRVFARRLGLPARASTRDVTRWVTRLRNRSRPWQTLERWVRGYTWSVAGESLTAAGVRPVTLRQLSSAVDLVGDMADLLAWDVRETLVRAYLRGDMLPSCEDDPAGAKAAELVEERRDRLEAMRAASSGTWSAGCESWNRCRRCACAGAMSVSRHLYLISYDIADPARLGRIGRYMASQGMRVQYSVFAAHLTANELEQVIAGLQERIDPHADDVRIYPVPSGARAYSLGRQLFPQDVMLISEGQVISRLGPGPQS